MTIFGPLAFAAPWALAALALLPVLWWLLRVTPPAPRRQTFPAIALLRGLSSDEDSAAHTPWWVLVLRLALAAALILAVAHPVINPGANLAGAGRGAGPVAGPIVVVVDDGWAAARDWPQRRAMMESLADRAAREGRPMVVLPTAPPDDGGPLSVLGPLAADQARAAMRALVPKPWASDRAQAHDRLVELKFDKTTSVASVWLSDGLASDGDSDLARRLQNLGGGLTIMVPSPSGLARHLSPPPATGSEKLDASPVLRRVAEAPAETIVVRALDEEGRVLRRQPVALAAGQQQEVINLALPGALRNRVMRLDIEGENGAAATALIDERWRRRPVGLVSGSAASGAQADAPLLSELYYLERALKDRAELHRGTLSALMEHDLAVIVLADFGTLSAADLALLEPWVEGGGMVVRFAGPTLARAVESGRDPGLVPVRLRQGGRQMGGTLSWGKASELAPFPETGPFAGLEAPPDITVSGQVLAEPSLDLNERSWARLADGTPLVTAAPSGSGWVVLVHTTANTQWSNLALSGLFPSLMERIVAASRGVSGHDQANGQANGKLPPLEMLDGLGRLSPPGPAAMPLPTEAASDIVPGPRHPPGFYGRDGARMALNLAPTLAPPKSLMVPPGAQEVRYGETAIELDLRPWLLALALALAVLDTAMALHLRGLLGSRVWGKGAAWVMLGLMLAIPQEGRAAAEDTPDEFALHAGLETRLAYIRTGDGGADAASRSGLTGLSKVLGQRSTAVLAEPLGIDVETQPLLFFPLVYWPVTEAQPVLSETARRKVNDYLRQGGMIVFDTKDPAGTGTGALQRLTEGLEIPPLAPVGEDHVLTRSFYLLQDLPGRLTGGSVWVAAADDGGVSRNDRVSPVVMGGHDWASAWAMDEAGRPLYAAVPGGERQRELAFRFGVNLVMYALTGNYKADQVHLPAILERLH